MKNFYVTLLLLWPSLIVNAQDSTQTLPWFVSRFKITAGLFVPLNTTEVSVSNAAETFGTTINLEDELGFDTYTTTFLSDFQYRPGKRSRIDLTYYRLSRTAEHTLQRDIKFANNTYYLNTTVNAFFKTSIYKLSYGYAFFMNSNYELGLMLGAHIVRGSVGMGIDGKTAEITYSDDFGFTAPLPNIGIWGGVALSNKLAFQGNISYLALTINDIRGRIISYDLSLNYMPITKLNLSLGYTGLNFRVDVEKERLQGYFRWGYNGPALKAAYVFGKSFADNKH